MGQYCPTCNGTGLVKGNYCKQCGGTKIVEGTGHKTCSGCKGREPWVDNCTKCNGSGIELF